MTRRFWLGFAAYLLPTFPLGYFWHLVFFAEQYRRLEMYRPEVIILMGLASMVIQASFFSWAYPRLFNTDTRLWLRETLIKRSHKATDDGKCIDVLKPMRISST